MCQGYRIAADLTEALKEMDLAEEANTGANRGEAPSEDYYRAAMGDDWRASDMFSDRERLAIDYAERIAVTPIPLPYDDAFWDQLQGALRRGRDRRPDLQHQHLDRDRPHGPCARPRRRLHRAPAVAQAAE